MTEETPIYKGLAVAYVRGKLDGLDDLSEDEILQAGPQAGLKLHRFKKTAELPRVRAVLGILKGLNPSSLLDIGSGRGVFLWSLVDEFPNLSVTAVDANSSWVEEIQTVSRGGITRLSGHLMDVSALTFLDRSFDVVTVLEVLEHLPEPEQAVKEVVRIAKSFVIASVPSKEDNNPEHLRVFAKGDLTEILMKAGAQSVKFQSVLNHMICIAKV